MADPPIARRYLLHLGLFLATCLTTTFAGLTMVGSPAPEFLMGGEGLETVGIDWAHWWRGLSFSATLMGILLCHEMGHYLAARRHGVDVSLPFFIPLPIGLGTLGAVIAMRERIRSRNALMDIGAAGPLAGLVVAIPLLVIGLALSDVEVVPHGQAFMREGNSILYLTLKYVVKGAILPAGQTDVMLHPIAWAAWCGLLVTMINLIPVGQLDGGHVAFAFFGDRYGMASNRFRQVLPVVGLAVMAYVFFDAWQDVATLPDGRAILLEGQGGDLVAPLWLNTRWEALSVAIQAALPWFVWYALLLAFRRAAEHPQVDMEPLSRGRQALGLLVMAIFVLICTPIPLRIG